MRLLGGAPSPRQPARGAIRRPLGASLEAPPPLLIPPPNARHHPPPRIFAFDDIIRVGGRVHAGVRRNCYDADPLIIHMQA